ncbi:MAG: HD domain-containing protein [Lachnospiraceae bacterium]|jgi:putative hydrolase of HD superfamily|nr:HD domain-containing protein [Lachnospiraceae bacterium]
MDAETIVSFLKIANNLKTNVRHCWTKLDRRESISDHSHRMILFAWLIKDEIPDLDMDRLYELCMWHDIGEAVVGDTPSFLKGEKEEVEELDATKKLFSSLPKKQEEELLGIIDEYNAKETLEAKVATALDKLEATLSHNESDLSTWLELEKTLNITYAKEAVAGFPIFEEIQEIIAEETREKIREEN